ncbi:hypothetical protein ACLQ29_31645 [Micromonospora sp. DT228]|uniref:hypothetical protein n=1 Tax=Micromonospora sp. DT228 TaxID=3393443 RepID=UPI003CEFB5E7
MRAARGAPTPHLPQPAPTGNLALQRPGRDCGGFVGWFTGTATRLRTRIPQRLPRRVPAATLTAAYAA